MQHNKIYTYYDDLRWAFQKDLLDIWTDNWKSMGFEPLIVRKEDAMSHDLYKYFDESLKKIHLKLYETSNINSYISSCWHRWLAYATIAPSNESFYVSDYDVFNTGWYPQKTEEKLHLMSDRCPCLASGTSLQFEELCHQFISLSEKNIEKIKKENTDPVYHDQNFFVICGDQVDNIIYTRLEEWFHQNPKLHHISHRAAHEKIREEGKQHNQVCVNEKRVAMAKELVY